MAAAPFSGAFQHARPCSSLGTRLGDSSLRIAVALCLGAPVCSPHDCVCGEKVDSLGSYGLSCRKSADGSLCQKSIYHLIKRALASAEIPSRLEPSYISRTNGRNRTVFRLFRGIEKMLSVWDFTCPDTFEQSYLKTKL